AGLIATWQKPSETPPISPKALARRSSVRILPPSRQYTTSNYLATAIECTAPQGGCKAGLAETTQIELDRPVKFLISACSATTLPASQTCHFSRWSVSRSHGIFSLLATLAPEGRMDYYAPDFLVISEPNNSVHFDIRSAASPVWPLGVRESTRRGSI